MGLEIQRRLSNLRLRLSGATKESEELRFWAERRATVGFSYHKYEYFYTEHFGFDRAFYSRKAVLDIGCGPQGSLEWADSSGLRVGLDPLALAYRRLGTGAHRMSYVAAGSEHIPFPAGHFDVVCAFNSLDHVDDLSHTIREIVRVLAPGGWFLLLSELNHAPTICEPVSYSWDIVDRFRPALSLVEERHYEKSEDGMYQSIRAGVPYDHADRRDRYGILSAKFRKP
jgi:ubiquinone/menaquinone biosynthesis C-methylase UbiE